MCLYLHQQQVCCTLLWLGFIFLSHGQAVHSQNFEGRFIDFFSLVVYVSKEVNLDGLYKFKPAILDDGSGLRGIGLFKSVENHLRGK